MKRKPTLEPTTAYESGIWGTTAQPCPSERTLAAHLDGELDAARAKAVDAHLDRCAACASDSRRLENLSDCLRAWGRGRAAVSPPPALLSRVLRTVSPEGSALRHEAAVGRRRLAARVALAAAAWGVAAGLGASALPFPAPTGAAPAGVQLAVPRPEPIVAAVPPPAPLSPAPARLSVALALLERVPPVDLGVLDDAEATAAVARAAAAPAKLDGRYAAVVGADGAASGASAGASATATATTSAERRARWDAERARLRADPRTADPAAAGVSLADAGLLAGTALSAGPVVEEPASLARGGVALRALPGTSSRGGAVPYDLATAARLDRVTLRPDRPGADGRSVDLEVAVGARPVFVPAGELLAGGVADRVVVEGGWLVPGERPTAVRLVTRPLTAVDPRGVGEPPRALGFVAGPAVRALLARGEDDGALAELTASLLRGAGLLGPEGSRAPSLVAVYARDADDVARRAGALVDALGDGAAGFLATDPDGRFQGLERVDLPEPARAPTLARLVAGYLAEARARSVVDAPRTGPRGLDVLGVLERRAPRLRDRAAPTVLATGAPGAAAAGSVAAVEPFAGLVLHGGLTGPGRVGWLSVLLPTYD